MAKHAIHWQWHGVSDFAPMFEAMKNFTDERGPETEDQLWFCEHPPVFTLGLAGRDEHVLAPGDIPVVKIDRGGQVTYHGPGQLMLYPLINLKRAGLGVRDLVCALERTIIDYCAGQAINAVGRRDAPGVYVGEEKLASIGLRIRRGASYHGLALNVAMDLEPFSRINPCGYRDLRMTDLKALGVTTSPQKLCQQLAQLFANETGLAASATPTSCGAL